MPGRGEDPRLKGSHGKTWSIPQKVGQFYYSYGLFATTCPITVLAAAVTFIVICCYPLINLPLPGNAPLLIKSSNITDNSGKQPFCYIQQVFLKVGVLPWKDDLLLGDAFRAPLYESFKLLDVVRNHQESSKTLGHICLHIEAVKKSKEKYQNVLPQYSCLVLSPANLWQQNVQEFGQDNSILGTVFNYHSVQKSKISISEMLFGLRIFDSGIKRYPMRNRQRVIQYAVTLFFKEYDESFLESLKQKLHALYPLFQNDTQTEQDNNLNSTIIIKYPGEINYLEFVPISIAFLILFIYYYFSIRKIELIKSKIGMAFTAVGTVLGSLTMTLGICFFFGLTLSLQGKEIFPYLAILVGIENVLVLTKSVVSTPVHLDIKIRIAQGLSKEGWSITKNLLIEITILTFGLFTFVPGIQEFCIFAIVGLITDFLLQMLFFSTILGIDIRRQENSYEKSNPNYRSSLFQSQAFYDSLLSEKAGLSRSKSHPRLSSFGAKNTPQSLDKKIPKRLRLVNIWARTRFFQRTFMVLMTIWISMIAYNSGIIEHYFLNNTSLDYKSSPQKGLQNFSSIKMLPLINNNKTLINFVTQNPLQSDSSPIDVNLDRLKHTEYSPFIKLSLQHWKTILKTYNMSLSGKYVTVLPQIKLSHVIRPEEAVLLRNPNEKYGDSFHWHALAAALDPLEFVAEEAKSKNHDVPQSEQPFYPSSPMELALTTILCLISIIVLVYTFVVLYRCICSRNYAEWRASWFNETEDDSGSGEEPFLLEAVPVVLDGHLQEIECLSTDGINMVSSCLGGFLNVWDNCSGELLASIDRNAYFNNDLQSENPSPRKSSLPLLKPKINTDFSSIKPSIFPQFPQNNPNQEKYDFTQSYNKLYQQNDENLLRNRNYANKSEDTSQSEYHQINPEVNCSKKSDSDLKRVKHVSFSDDVVTNSDSNQNSPIWCLDYLDNLIVIGCANGRIEFWEATSAQLKCVYKNETDIGITNIKIIGSKVVAARLYGTLDFFSLQTYNNGRPVDWNFTCAYRRTRHIRTGSVGSLSDHNKPKTQGNSDDDLKCTKLVSIKAHPQPITCLDCEGGRVMTGSQDHTLRVFQLEDGKPLYSLHGHCGPITCLFIDKINPATSASGSQDGMLCMWDMSTGTCVYNIQAHDGHISSLTYSASYVISLGSDERLCVWERFQGHLLNTIHVSQTFSSQVLMLAPHLVVTARSGGLVIWDVRSGECVRTIALGRSPYVFIKQLILLRDAVLCDYGNQLRIVRFPLITHKFD